jgi:ketosteroid isomerase-like protein
VSQENVETMRRCLDSWNRGDCDAWMESFHPEIEYSSPIARQVEGEETVWRGTAGARRFWDEWHAVWNVSIELSETRDLGDMVFALGRMETRGRASGVELESPVAYVAAFEAGLMRKLRAYRSASEAREAVGLEA